VTQNGAGSATPPTAAINGDNPAILHIGDSYANLGATITGPSADLNLDIKTFLNGRLVLGIVLDTTSVATDTTDYVVTDGAGVTATSTRTVVVEAAPSMVPTDDASTTATTTVKSQLRTRSPRQRGVEGTANYFLPINIEASPINAPRIPTIPGIHMRNNSPRDFLSCRIAPLNLLIPRWLR
jgi:hypothetical protein